MLSLVDPESAAAIHENNVKRVIRALEFYEKTGLKISEHNEAERKKESPYAFAYYVLTMERDLLYRRIEKRVDRMMESGLLDEVKALKLLGCKSSMVSMQGLGYKEILAFLDRGDSVGGSSPDHQEGHPALCKAPVNLVSERAGDFLDSERTI